MSVIDFNPAISTVKAEKLRRRVGASKIPPPRTLSNEEWPPDYEQVLAWRQIQLARFEVEPELVQSAKAYYKDNLAEFINHWCNTYDPRNAATGKPVWMPMVLFDRQDEMVQFILACLRGEENGLVEKSRTMGATWTAIGVSVGLWLFWDQSAVGWGSQDQPSVDRLGDPKSVFEKTRMLIRGLPDVLKPKGFIDRDHLTYMRCLNPENGSSIIGEVGDNIGRGGRTLIYFVDEAAHLKRPEKNEAALLETTRVRIDVSSVSGLGTVFHRKRESGVDWAPGQPIVKGTTNVFIMDWSDHPEKTPEWHAERKKKLDSEGMPHVFAQEVDRNYSAAVEGVIIKAEWVAAAIDAHLKLDFDDEGPNVAGLDVADGGMDTNALIKRKGPILKSAQTRASRDTGETARWAIDSCRDALPIELQYDCIGVGSGIKSEANRLRDEGLMPKGLTLVPWNAAFKPLDPFKNIIEDDKDSPLNRDFYENLKAQGWWMLRRRFELTFRAINEPGFTYDPQDLISIPSTIPLLRQLQKELSQATASRTTGRMKLVVNKSPEGTRSPNLADGTVEAFWPWHGLPTPTAALIGPIVIHG